VCGYHIDEETPILTVNECPHGFKHKDQYVELPAYIGQPVFAVHTKHKFIDNEFVVVGYELREGKVSMIQQKADKSWKFRITMNSSVCDYTVDEIGKTIFFSEAEATELRDKWAKELNA
jgi:hypothetical protein